MLNLCKISHRIVSCFSCRYRIHMFCQRYHPDRARGPGADMPYFYEVFVKSALFFCYELFFKRGCTIIYGILWPDMAEIIRKSKIIVKGITEVN